MLCHPEPHFVVSYALRNVKSPITGSIALIAALR